MPKIKAILAELGVSLAFNSLFEMLAAVACRTRAVRMPFNSLFEMRSPRRRGARRLVRRRPLSILYLRCHGASVADECAVAELLSILYLRCRGGAGAPRLPIRNGFQFSI